MRLGPGVLVAMLAMEGDVAARQAPVPQPMAEPPPRRLTLETVFPPADTPVPAPDRIERGWTPQLELTFSCPSCPDERRPPVIGAQPQWTVHATSSLGDDRQRLTLGLAGQRNARLPLFMTETLAGDALPMPPSAMTTMGDTLTRWQATVQAERLLWRSRGGVTLHLVGEAVVPLVPSGSEQSGAVRSRNLAGRGAFRVRF